MPSPPLVSEQTDLEKRCRTWRKSGVFAFDTEFIRDETFDATLCLVQVAALGEVVLIDPTAGLDLNPFWDLAADPAVVTIVHAGKEDFDVGQRAAGRLPRNVFDVQIAAGFVGRGYPLSLSRLVDQVLGKRLSKGHTLTDWLRRPLTPEQLRYAVDDVKHLTPLFATLSAEINAAGRNAWAREEFERFEHADFYRIAPQERAQRLRGSQKLDGLGLLVLEKLIAWREKWAKERNRPTRALVRDDILVEIAHRRPKAARDLEILRGFPQAKNAAVVGELMAIIADAERTPPGQRPQPAPKLVEAPLDKAMLDLVSSVIQCICHEENLNWSLLGSAQRLRELMDYHAGRISERPSLLRGWRDEFIGERLLDLLEGRSHVSVRGWPTSTFIVLEPTVKPALPAAIERRPPTAAPDEPPPRKPKPPPKRRGKRASK